MFYCISTKRGVGAELWGTYDDLRTIYEVIGKYWKLDDYGGKKEFDTRDQVISSFVHEIRKGYEGGRLTRKSSHFMPDPIPFFGCTFSWVHIIFAMNAIRFNMRFAEASKMDIGLMLQLEYWLEESMHSYDPTGASALISCLNGAIEGGNPYLYQFMRSTNAEFISFGGGKTAFRNLGKLMKKGIYGTVEYTKYNVLLMQDAKRLNCEISDLELSDDHIDYDGFIW